MTIQPFYIGMNPYEEDAFICHRKEDVAALIDQNGLLPITRVILCAPGDGSGFAVDVSRDFAKEIFAAYIDDPGNAAAFEDEGTFPEFCSAHLTNDEMNQLAAE